MPKEKENLVTNYIPISRKIFEHEFWKEDRVFSRAEAWIDLLRSVSWEDGNTSIINGQWVKWERGQMPVSLRFLGSRWKWSRSKVSLFLENLRREKMIEIVTAKETVITVLTVCKYGDYNPVSKKKGQQKGQSSDSEVTVEGQSSDKLKESNKVKEVKEVSEVYTQEDISLFNSFIGWIGKNAPKVNEMRETISIKQFLKLRKDYPGDAGRTLIQDVLLSMHNYKDLLKKYESSNLTLRSWINIRKKKNGEPTKNDSGKKLSGIVAEIRHQEAKQ